MSENLPDYIQISQNSKEYVDLFLAENSYSHIFVLVDENTRKHCLPIFKDSFSSATIIDIKSGEEYKTLQTCIAIWNVLTQANADRKSLLINLGGGVIGDMGGFCASTYKRGIDFINIPTTLLSQVDASIGGKLGIDFNGFKNHIGLFKLPIKVIIDTAFLKTLPQNQIKSGFAEMLKHGFIYDKNYLQELAKIDINKTHWGEQIKKSVLIKNEIVSTDPTEKNERKFLNFGHTIGHAVESYFLNNGLPILHGEAIALGMIAETYLSIKKIGLNRDEKKEIIRVIDSFFERVEIPANGVDEILNNLMQDKKNNNSEIQAVLLKQIGMAKHSIKIYKRDVEEALSFYASKGVVKK